ncbi:MAG: MFS transporter [Acidobacteria bacterium]|nr:MFS transporter [Acidobacteriota bacterium]
MTVATLQRTSFLAVLVAALGYFVDIYDLILFSVVRVQSLLGIGVPEDQLLATGVLLLNMQMGGMLVGGMLWGVLGDRRGRLSVLFGSIAMYSVANIANGLVDSVGAYAAWRFIAGVGLAGELGAGVTLVSEVMTKEARGYGAMIVSAVGILGAVVGALVGDLFDWRIAYFVGGAMGIALLILRIGVAESGMFEQVRHTAVRKGDFLMLFRTAERRRRYISVILIGVPIWYVIGILVTFAPEFGRAMGMTEIPLAGRAVMFCYAGLSLGSLLSGTLSQVWRTRKRVVRAFMIATTVSIAVYFVAASVSLTVFYAVCLMLGVATGYWALFVLMASEQFGTNIRATATTTVPNFVRGSVVLVTSLFQFGTAYLGVQGSAIAVGLLTLVVAFLALERLPETYAKDLDYIEGEG